MGKKKRTCSYHHTQMNRVRCLLHHQLRTSRETEKSPFVGILTADLSSSSSRCRPHYSSTAANSAFQIKRHANLFAESSPFQPVTLSLIAICFLLHKQAKTAVTPSCSRKGERNSYAFTLCGMHDAMLWKSSQHNLQYVRLKSCTDHSLRSVLNFVAASYK